MGIRETETTEIQDRLTKNGLDLNSSLFSLQTIKQSEKILTEVGGRTSRCTTEEMWGVKMNHVDNPWLHETMFTRIFNNVVKFQSELHPMRDKIHSSILDGLL